MRYRDWNSPETLLKHEAYPNLKSKASIEVAANYNENSTLRSARDLACGLQAWFRTRMVTVDRLRRVSGGSARDRSNRS
jgi:hypothetical protein